MKCYDQPKRRQAGRRALTFQFSVWRSNFPEVTSAKSAEGCKGCTTEKSTAKGEFSISSTNTSASCRGLFPAPPYKKIQQKDDKINFFLQQFLLSFLTRYPFFARRFYIFLFLFLLSRILCFACHGSPFVHEYQLTTQPVHPTTPSRRRVGSGLPHRSHGKKLENQTPPKKKRASKKIPARGERTGVRMLASKGQATSLFVLRCPFKKDNPPGLKGPACERQQVKVMVDIWRKDKYCAKRRKE